jgi:hypothetical protein
MNIRLLPIVSVCLVLAVGCEQTPSATAEDVAEVREEAVENSIAARDEADKVTARTSIDLANAAQDSAKTEAKARTDMTEAEAKATVAMARADFEVAMTDARGGYDIAREKCNALKSAARDACLSKVSAILAADETAAIDARDLTIAAANR